MSKNPFFQFYPSDWLAGTRGLTAAETGVYITLIAMMYEAEGPIANDPKRLARLCGSTPSTFTKAVAGLVETGKITEDERGFFNRRVEIEIGKRSEKRAAASASATARWGKDKQKQHSADATASDPQCERNANQKPEPEPEPEDSSDNTENFINDVPADAGPPPADDRYAFAGKTIRLNGRDLERWRSAYSHISLEAELWSLDEWATEQKAAGKNWFSAVSSALAKREREAKHRIQIATIRREAGLPARAMPDPRL